MARNSRIGHVYLLHFSEPVGHAQHYLGWALDVERRLAAHRNGTGGRLPAAASRRGITITVVRVWENKTRGFERSLKNGTHKRHCPLCKAEHNQRERDRMRRVRATKKEEQTDGNEQPEDPRSDRPSESSRGRYPQVRARAHRLDCAVGG